MNAEVDLVELLIRAIDGEKDPRCLLHAFECVTAISKLCPPVGAFFPDASVSRPAEKRLYEMVGSFTFPASHCIDAHHTAGACRGCAARARSGPVGGAAGLHHLLLPHLIPSTTRCQEAHHARAAGGRAAGGGWSMCAHIVPHQSRRRGGEGGGGTSLGMWVTGRKQEAPSESEGRRHFIGSVLNAARGCYQVISSRS